MTVYNIEFYNDMGHLMITPDISHLPQHIYNFAKIKAKTYLDTATDNKGLGCLFFFLKPGLSKQWSYQYGPDTVNINYNVDTFDPKYMIITSVKHL
jgi:hypothetical protein